MAMAAKTSKAMAQPGTPSYGLDDGLLSLFLVKEELVTLLCVAGLLAE